MFKIKAIFPVSGVTVLGLAVLFSGCLTQDFSIGIIKGASRSTASLPAAGTQTPTAVVFRTLQPALAVRGANCIMCHAQIVSNVITDFGAGDPYFFDKDKGSCGFYSDCYGGWPSGGVQGTVFVPKVVMDHSFSLINQIDPQKKKPSFTLSQAMQSPQFNSDGSVSKPSMVTGVSPKEGGSAVVEKNHIYIGAPTEAELLALAPEITESGFKIVKVDGVNLNSALPLSGLHTVSGSSGSYVTNSPTEDFVCAGDVFVRGTLFLNAPALSTDNQGCRLYVSGSVFIRGAIKYKDASLSSANLQITSAKMIAMGFNLTTLKRRLLVEGDRAGLNYMPTTRSTEVPLERHNGLIKEAAAITGLVDADNETSIENPMSGVLLNAPEVHSRYTGNFKGSVVSEMGMFRLGQFEFSFDPVFQKVPILPALKSDILSVTDQ